MGVSAVLFRARCYHKDNNVFLLSRLSFIRTGPPRPCLEPQVQTRSHYAP